MRKNVATQALLRLILFSIKICKKKKNTMRVFIKVPLCLYYCCAMETSQKMNGGFI